MRIVRPERDLARWEQIGWDRPPRNGLEKKLVDQGKPQPKEREKAWRYPYRCKIHGKGVPHKVVDNAGKRARRCIKCDHNRRKRYDITHEAQNKERKVRLTREARNAVPVFEDGFASVSGTWLRHNVSGVADYLKHGSLVVEILGEPSYIISGVKP